MTVPKQPSRQCLWGQIRPTDGEGFFQQDSKAFRASCTTRDKSLMESYRQIFPANTIIFREGEHGECAYVLERGKVEIFMRAKKETRMTAVLFPGDIFGEMALIDNDCRSATAITTKETEVVVITREYAARKLALADPLTSLFLKVVLERFREMRYCLLQATGTQSVHTSSFPLQANLDSHRKASKRVTEQIKALHELRIALDEQQFELYYQPIITLNTGSLYGFEALSRWRHPQRGIVPPSEFIPLLESTGLIELMGEWVLEEAFRALPALQQESADAVRLVMSINLSGASFSSDSQAMALVERVSAIQQKTGVASECVKLEITETLLMANPEVATTTLQRFKNMGFSIAIDDFGTGYSSFNYLYRFPLDTLKIDRSFVISMHNDPKSLKIVHSLCNLAANLDMSVVAEGVEKRVDMEQLRAFGATHGQGYLFSKPLPFGEVSLLVRNWSTEQYGPD